MKKIDSKPKNAPDILQKRIDFNISLCKKSNGMKINLQRAAQNVVELQRGLTGSRALAGNGYMQKGASLQAYLLYYWPPCKRPRVFLSASRR